MNRLAVAVAAALAFGFLPLLPASAQGPSAGDREAIAESPAQSRSAQLDALFQTLAAADSPEAAKTAEGQILEVWFESGSDTVDVLMDWTLEAMDKEDYPRALDFLDRITTLAPGYVEGWNKRATVHFLTDDYARSIADIEQVLAIEPRHFGALAGLGTILRELGDDTLALAAYRQALELDPFMEDVQKAIDELEADGGGQDI